MKIYQKGWDYFGYFAWIKVGQGGIDIRFDTGGIEFGINAYINWRDGHIGIRIINLAITYFFKTDWENLISG